MYFFRFSFISFIAATLQSKEFHSIADVKAKLPTRESKFVEDVFIMVSKVPPSLLHYPPSLCLRCG